MHLLDISFYNYVMQSTKRVVTDSSAEQAKQLSLSEQYLCSFGFYLMS